MTTDADEDDEIQQQWPGFKVTCLKCGSDRVELNNSLGYSYTSGSWGSIDLYCTSCGEGVSIFEH